MQSTSNKGLVVNDNQTLVLFIMKIIRAFMRFFFYHFYHGLSWTYDLVAYVVSLGQWKDWVLAAIPFIEGKVVLELGFGPGHLQAELPRYGYTMFGLDESRQMAVRAARRLQKLGLTPRLVCGFAQALPYPECFDTVVATFPTEYITSGQTLAEIMRVLKPGGLLVILPMAWQDRDSLPGRGADWLFRVTGQREDDSEFLREQIKIPFENAGFRVETQTHKFKTSTLLFVLARKPDRL